MPNLEPIYLLPHQQVDVFTNQDNHQMSLFKNF